jgi:uncharacterized protein involved in exopolysaccharide biosynthesis
MSENIQNLNEENIGIDVKQVFFKYLYFWKWFILCFIITFTCSYFYLRYATPSYNIEATILIKDDKKGVNNTGVSNLIVSESKDEGHVKWIVYKEYF